jgi:surface antigen
MINKSVIALGAAVLLIAGCTQDEYGRTGINGMGTKQSVGTVAGAIGGGVLGHNIGKGAGSTVGAIAGTLLGAYIGSSIGESLDRADVQYYNRTSQQAMETGQPGQPFPWQNPQNGHGGTVVPQGYYQTSDGRYCREYNQTIQIDGRSQSAHGRACREPDGTWQVVQ